jgi:hypothetical protein
MANSCFNHLALSGAEEAVKSAVADATSEANVLNAEVRIENSIDAGGDVAHADIVFGTRWHGSFDEARALSSRHPDVVFTLAAVELGNGVASATVWKDGGVLGGYDMPRDEQDRLAGQDVDESAVVETLFATVAAYEEDALAANGRVPG